MAPVSSSQSEQSILRGHSNWFREGHVLEFGLVRANSWLYSGIGQGQDACVPSSLFGYKDQNLRWTEQKALWVRYHPFTYNWKHLKSYLGKERVCCSILPSVEFTELETSGMPRAARSLLYQWDNWQVVFFFFFAISLKVCSLSYKLWWYNYVIFWHNFQIICAFKVSLLNARELLLMLQ